MAPRFLLIIDVQRGFINRWTRHIPDKVERVQDDFERLWVTRFFNPEGSLQRRLMGWGRFAPGSDDTRLAFTPRAGAPVIGKSTYTCVTRDLLQALEGDGIATVHLAGIATDNCVLKSAVDLFEAGIEPVVLADHCASHGGPDCHEAGLKLLKRFIGEGQVVAYSATADTPPDGP